MDNDIFYNPFDGDCEPEPEPEPKSLRDEFAMAALTGLMACDSESEFTKFANWAYEVADAMLEARKR